MISVICVYNDKKVFEEYLVQSLQRQTADSELIALDNSGGRFGSAAQALNYGARQIRSGAEYIMFAHQDIELGSATWLEDAEKMLDTLPQLGIAGVAGNNEQENRLIANITHGSPPRRDGKRIERPVRVMAIDECCAIVPRAVFQKQHFDEGVCNDWHLYAVEYCLRMQSQGLETYVLPVEMHHASTGSLNSSYLRTLKKILRMYRSRYAVIYTACGNWDTRKPVRLQWIMRIAKKIFYGFTGRLIAAGLVPEFLQRKKRKRLQRMSRNR